MMKRALEKPLFIIYFFAVILFFAANPARSEEKTLSETSRMDSIRPKVEYITEGSKEPFLDYFSKKKPVTQVTVETGVAAAAAPEEPKPKPPLPSLTVQGIIWGSSMPCAIINNEVVKQGDSIEEVELIKIEKESIEVLYQGWNYSLPSPAGLSLNKKPEGGRNE